MPTPLSEALIPRLRAAFDSASMRLDEHGETLAVFPAVHPEVGDVVIEDCDE